MKKLYRNFKSSSYFIALISIFFKRNLLNFFLLFFLAINTTSAQISTQYYEDVDIFTLKGIKPIKRGFLKRRFVHRIEYIDKIILKIYKYGTTSNYCSIETFKKESNYFSSYGSFTEKGTQRKIYTYLFPDRIVIAVQHIYQEESFKPSFEQCLVLYKHYQDDMSFGLEISPSQNIDKQFYARDEIAYKERKKHLFIRTDFIIKEKYILFISKYTKNRTTEKKHILHEKYSLFWDIYLSVPIL